MKQLKNISGKRRRGYVWQKGQAMIEYTVVATFGILVLTTGPGRGVIGDLEDAVRNNYDGFSYAVSLSDYPDKEDLDELKDMYDEQGMPSDQSDYLADDPVDLVSELTGFDFNSLPDVGQGVDMVDGLGLGLDDFCDICSGNPFDAL